MTFCSSPSQQLTIRLAFRFGREQRTFLYCKRNHTCFLLFQTPRSSPHTHNQSTCEKVKKPTIPKLFVWWSFCFSRKTNMSSSSIFPELLLEQADGSDFSGIEGDSSHESKKDGNAAGQEAAKEDPPKTVIASQETRQVRRVRILLVGVILLGIAVSLGTYFFVNSEAENDHKISVSLARPRIVSCRSCRASPTLFVTPPAVRPLCQCYRGLFGKLGRKFADCAPQSRRIYFRLMSGRPSRGT